VNFADILNEWDRRNRALGRGRRTADPGIFDKDEENPEEDKIHRRGRLLRKKPDAAIDLHGLSKDEAWDALDDFFNQSRVRGHEKILVIHGKGNHSSGESEGVLKEISRKFIEHCPYAGESGSSSNSTGGSGATWVLLKPEKTRP